MGLLAPVSPRSTEHRPGSSATVVCSSVTASVDTTAIGVTASVAAVDRQQTRILNSPHHTLYKLLPPQSAASQNYNLRRRTHDRQLHQHQGHLSDCNFVTRLLNKNSYWLNNMWIANSSFLLCRLYHLSIRALWFHLRFVRCHSKYIQSVRPLVNRERKCADTTGTVLVHWAGHFQC